MPGGTTTNPRPTALSSRRSVCYFRFSARTNSSSIDCIHFRIDGVMPPLRLIQLLPQAFDLGLKTDDVHDHLVVQRTTPSEFVHQLEPGILGEPCLRDEPAHVRRRDRAEPLALVLAEVQAVAVDRDDVLLVHVVLLVSEAVPLARGESWAR
jgi:hypothetical protein